MTNARKLFTVMFLFMLPLLFLAVGVASGEEAETKPQEINAEISFVSANGNTKATTLSSKTMYRYDWRRVGLELEGGALGSRSQGQVTAEQYFLGEKVLGKWSERNFVFEEVRWDKDRFSGIKDRYEASVGLGRNLIDNPHHKLIIELGSGYTIEDRLASANNDFVSGRAYARYKRVLSQAASFRQDIEYLPNLEDANDYRLQTESAITAALSTHLSWKTTFQWKRVNEPPENFLKDDTLVLLSIIFNY